MKKNKGLILILVLLLAATAYFVINRGKGTIDKELSNFAFSDTAAITKIFLADRTGASVTLLRKSAGEWELSDGSEVRSDAMNNLLACIKDVGVRSPVANAAYNNVVKAIATKGIKVEIYTDKGPVKTYYVGGPTQDQMGTFMHLEGSSRPFVTQIPGFNGYLTPRYITKVADWKTKRIFRLKPSEIKTVTAVDKSVEGAAVRIESEGKDGFLLFNATGEAVAGASQDKIFSYLEFYGSINYESDEKSLTSFQRDSLLASEPFREVFVEDKSGRKKLIKLWKRPQTPTTQNKTNASGEPFPYDIDRMTARLEGDTALIVVQYYMFDKLFRRPADFLVKP